MRNAIGTAAILCFSATMALAQTPNQPNPGTPLSPSATQPGGATQPGSSTQSGAQNLPGSQTGAQVGTEAQAKSKIESEGFSNVTELKKQNDGKWTAKAMKAGKSSQITLDTNGRITEAN